MPVLKTKKALDSMAPGQTLFVEATDKGSNADISALLKRTGNELLESDEEEHIYRFLIKKSK
jgi:tRNA 2-thiouridine synthesizing protein A